MKTTWICTFRKEVIPPRGGSRPACSWCRPLHHDAPRVNADCVDWADGQGVFRSCGVADATAPCIVVFGGIKLEHGSCLLIDLFRWGQTECWLLPNRCIIEIEVVNHQSSRETRWELAAAAVYFRDLLPYNVRCSLVARYSSNTGTLRLLCF
jgi:hypothetical protein